MSYNRKQWEKQQKQKEPRKNVKFDKQDRQRIKQQLKYAA